MKKKREDHALDLDALCSLVKAVESGFLKKGGKWLVEREQLHIESGGKHFGF